MVTLRRPRCEEPRQFMRRTHVPYTSSSTEFQVITLHDPVVDPEWMFHHPRFRRETKTSATLPQNERGFYAKKVYSRVPSATGNARSKLLCERRERSDQGNTTCRHFCELLGPNLCKECWKFLQRADALKEHRASYPREMKSGKDSFSAMIAARDKGIEYNDSEEEILNDAEDEEFIFQSMGSRKTNSMTPPQDSGYSSRMSYIRSLSRTPSGDFCPRVTSRCKFTRGNVRTSDYERRVSANNQRRPSDVESTPIWRNAYLAKLREKEPFRDILTNSLHYPRKSRHAWRGLPVEPVVMDLKFINFTIYDDVRLNERAVNKNAKA